MDLLNKSVTPAERLLACFLAAVIGSALGLAFSGEGKINKVQPIPVIPYGKSLPPGQVKHVNTFVVASLCVSVVGADSLITKGGTNLGLKDRDIGSTLLSKGVSSIEFRKEKGYSTVKRLRPYILEASVNNGIPPVVIASIIFEEAVHRKPLDLTTFGVAQVGVGELREQNLPPNPQLLENEELCVWVLARKLKRLQAQTGSLNQAIALHNGYKDFLSQVLKRSNDKLIQGIVNSDSVQTFI